MKSKLFAALLGISVAATSAPAFAFSLSDIVTTSVNANIANDVAVEVSNVNANVNVNGSASVTSETSAHANSGSGSDGSAGSVQTTGSLDPVVVTRADVENNTVTATAVSVSSIDTDTDLSGFIAAQMKTDGKVSAVETSGQKVEVVYETPAKLFGIFPLTVDTTVIVEADGTVDVAYPWYAFLLTTAEKDLETQLQTAVKTELSAASGSVNGMANAVVQADAEDATNLTSEMQAKLISDIRAVMHAASETEASASANADANVNVQ